MKPKSYIFHLLFTFSQINIFAQIGINASNTAPNSNAMLDVSSTTKGVLFPRMTTAQRNSLTAVATDGLTVYDTDTKGYWFWNGTVWQNLAGVTSPQWTNSGSDIFNNNGGNVGIGTNTPTQKLEVAGASILANSTGININNYLNKIVAGKLTDPSLTLENGISGKQSFNGSTWSLGGSFGDFFIGVGDNFASNSQQIGLQIKANRNVLIAPVSGKVAIGGNGLAPTSTLSVYGSVTYKVAYTNGASYSLTDSDHILYCDLENDAEKVINVALPTPNAAREGRVYTILLLNAPEVHIGKPAQNKGCVNVSGAHGAQQFYSHFDPGWGKNEHKLFYTTNICFGCRDTRWSRTMVSYICVNGNWHKLSDNETLDSDDL